MQPLWLNRCYLWAVVAIQTDGLSLEEAWSLRRSQVWQRFVKSVRRYAWRRGAQLCLVIMNLSYLCSSLINQHSLNKCIVTEKGQWMVTRSLLYYQVMELWHGNVNQALYARLPMTFYARLLWLPMDFFQHCLLPVAQNQEANRSSPLRSKRNRQH